MIRAETDVKNLLHALKFIDKKEMPKAVAKSLNDTADAVGSHARKNAKKRLKIRRPYSIRGIKQDRHAKGDNISRMFSRAVVQAKYMVSQELGGKVDPQPGFDKVAIPTLFARAGNIMSILLKKFWLDKTPPNSNIGESYSGKGFARFFIGKPKGKNRAFGIWYRHNNNERITMVRSLTQTSIIRKPVNFFEDAVRKFGSKEFIMAQLSKNAKEAIKKTGLGENLK